MRWTWNMYTLWVYVCWCWGLPWWRSGKDSASNAGAAGDVCSIPGSWRRAWQPTPVLLPGDSHGQRSLVGYNPQGHRVRQDWNDLAHTHSGAGGTGRRDPKSVILITTTQTGSCLCLCFIRWKLHLTAVLSLNFYLPTQQQAKTLMSTLPLTYCHCILKN